MSGPPGATITPSGHFSWVPTPSLVGPHTIVVKILNKSGAFILKSFTILVDNGPPVIDPIPDVTDAHPGTPVSFTASASDPDNDPLTFSLVSGPPGASLTESGSFFWTPDWPDLGAHPVTVKVTDPGGLSDTKSCTVTVVNKRPVMDPISDQQVDPETPVSFTASASDPDNDLLTFSLVSGPPGASLTPDGSFFWVPDSADAGPHVVTIQVSDPGNLSDSKSCTITVNNPPPVV
jgi:hypothetical protein